MKPSEVCVDGPLTGLFGKVEMEWAAALVILGCRDRGDEWGFISCRDLEEVIKRDWTDRAWIPFSFAPGSATGPMFQGLVDWGWAEGDEGWEDDPLDCEGIVTGTCRTCRLPKRIRFTQAGLSKIESSHHFKPMIPMRLCNTCGGEDPVLMPSGECVTCNTTCSCGGKFKPLGDDGDNARVCASCGFVPVWFTPALGADDNES